MRPVTQEEATRWMELAKSHGFVNADGEFGLGRFLTTQDGDGNIVLQVITPIPAGLYTEDLQKKAPPILFDRTPAGEIIIPGRWWAHMFDQVSREPDAPAKVRADSARLARSVEVEDILLPADVETIEILAPDEDGRLVPTEALPPGGQIAIHVQRM